MTLRELISAYDANGFFLVHANNVLVCSEVTFFLFENEMDQQYGEIEMRKLKTADYFDTAVPEEAEYASDWIIQGQNETLCRIKLFF